MGSQLGSGFVALSPRVAGPKVSLGRDEGKVPAEYRPMGSRRFPSAPAPAKIGPGRISRPIVFRDHRSITADALGARGLLVDGSWTLSRAGAGALVAWAALAIAGCGGSADPSGSAGPSAGPAAAGVKPTPGRIVLVTNGNSDWWSAVEKGMKDGAAKHGADVEMKRNQEGAGTEGQIRLLEEALGASEIKAVAVSAVDADAPGIADAMKKLKAAGKQVIAIDSGREHRLGRRPEPLHRDR